MLKMTRKLQKVLELVQEELIIDYNLDQFLVFTFIKKKIDLNHP